MKLSASFDDVTVGSLVTCGEEGGVVVKVVSGDLGSFVKVAYPDSEEFVTYNAEMWAQYGLLAYRIV